jgi:hypothetical protein
MMELTAELLNSTKKMLIALHPLIRYKNMPKQDIHIHNYTQTSVIYACAGFIRSLEKP